MEQNTKVIVIGATQGTGKLIVERLLGIGFDVSVLARDQAKAERTFANHNITIIEGDITDRSSLPTNLNQYNAIILTAGVTKRPAGETLVRATEYEGTTNVLDIAKQSGFQGRFLYMTTIGTDKRTWLGMTLNLIKGKTLVWRKEAEVAIRSSGLRYTIIRAGILNDKPPGTHQLMISVNPMPLTLQYQISRSDVADIFVEALKKEGTINQAFNVVWASKGNRQPIDSLLQEIV